MTGNGDAPRPSLAPRLFLWGARTLFLGRALGLSAHRNAVAVLCAGVDAPFDVARDPKRSEDGYFTCRTALIPANTLHHLRCGEGTMAFLYVDARSEDYKRLAASMAMRHGRFSAQLSNEPSYLALLAALRDDAPWLETRSALAAALDLPSPGRGDERIATALHNLRVRPEDAHTLDEVARKANLSASRFLHLFKATTGVPFRRYRIWARMGAAVRSMAAGQSLTEAAFAAGFSSSSHFSAAFREMFGLPPSQLTASPLTIRDGKA